MPGEPDCETKIETTIETPSNRSRHFEVYSRGIFWSGRRDSNPRPRAWEAPTLPTELRSPGGWGGDCNSLLGEVFGEEADEGARRAGHVGGGAEGDRFL